MFKKVNSKSLAYIILLIFGITFFLKKVIHVIERPYLKKMWEDWQRYPEHISAKQITYTTLLIDATGLIAFVTSLVVLVLYMCFAKHKFWRELWLGCFILIIIHLSSNIAWITINHEWQQKPGWHTTIDDSHL